MQLFESVEELKQACKTASPGDILKLRNGTYKDVSFTLEGRGLPDKKIFVLAETDGEVIFTGKSTLNIKGSYIVAGGFTFKDGGSNRPIRLIGSYNRLCNIDFYYNDVEVDRQMDMIGSGCRIDHCTFHPFDKTGVYLGVVRDEPIINYAIVDHNKFGPRPQLEGETNGLECIRIGTSHQSLSNSRSVIEHNFFDTCDGEIEVISNKACENIIRNNTLTDCKGTITIRHGNRCYLYKNHIDAKGKEGSGGIRVIGEDHKIWNNLIENVNGNGTTEVGISISGGQSSPRLNGYQAANNTECCGNTFVNCEHTFALGTMIKDCKVKPENVCIAECLVYNSEDGKEVFSTDSDNKGADDLDFEEVNVYSNVDDDIIEDEGIEYFPPEEFDEEIDRSKYGYKNDVGFSVGFDYEGSDLTMSNREYYEKVLAQIGGEEPETETETEPSEPPHSDTDEEIDEDTHTLIQNELETACEDKYCRLGKYTIGEPDISRFVVDDKLEDCYFDMSFTIENVDFYPTRFEYAIENDDKGIIFHIPAPEDGWKVGKNVIKYIPKDDDYVNISDEDYMNMDRLELYRSGPKEGSEDTIRIDYIKIEKMLEEPPTESESDSDEEKPPPGGSDMDTVIYYLEKIYELLDERLI